MRIYTKDPKKLMEYDGTHMFVYQTQYWIIIGFKIYFDFKNIISKGMQFPLANQGLLRRYKTIKNT